MSDIFKAFEKFLFRDISFLLGGSVVLASGMYVFGKLPTGDVPGFKYFIWGGISYAVGYSIQEVFTLLQLVRTKAGLPPSKVGKWLYCHFDHKPILAVDQYEEAKRWLYKEASERFQNDHERIESLKQVGTALGPCFFISGIILPAKIFLANMQNHNLTGQELLLQLTVSLGLVGLGLILILLGWLKVTQQAQYLITRFKAAKEPQQPHQ